VALLDAAITNNFVDLDADSTGLNFSSSALNSSANGDDRLRETGANTANDLVMAYVLYKLYGMTSVSTKDEIFNLEDAHGMLDNTTLKDAIKNSIVGNHSAIASMFKNLISSDPQRFFDAQGKQIAGIFEVKSDSSSSGIWNLTADDIIEIRVKFSFGAVITRRDVADGQLSGDVNTKEVASTEQFAIRLQIKASA
jgi:hypothetical protein